MAIVKFVMKIEEIPFPVAWGKTGLVVLAVTQDGTLDNILGG
ncbi:hypothetical protein [Komagataeibacter europaeus]|nr:hypothetical protein [Komagataeibacter europaeus]